MQEEKTIIQLHALLGNRWSAIATHLSKQTNNKIIMKRGKQKVDFKLIENSSQCHAIFLKSKDSYQFEACDIYYVWCCLRESLHTNFILCVVLSSGIIEYKFLESMFRTIIVVHKPRKMV